MKKEIILLLLPASFLFTSFRTGCSKDSNLKNNGRDDDKVYLHKRKGIKGTVSLGTRDQLDSVALYDDARIRITQEGCHFCQSAKKTLDSLIESSEIVIYEVSYRDVYYDACNDTKTGGKDADSKYTGLYPDRAKYGTPFYRFYSNGKLVNTQSSTGTDEAFFADRFSTYTSLTNLYQRNDYSYDSSRDTYVLDSSENYAFSENLDYLGFGTDRLDALLGEDKSKIILYSWRRCSDCKNYREKVLYPFRKKYPNQAVYYYETDGYRRFKRRDDEQYQAKGLKIWSDFCQKFHLSDYPKTDINGNVAGFVPTTVFQKSDRSYSLSVFSNEQEVVINEDRSLSFKTAFYPEITEIRSKTKLKSGDTEGSSSYIKALKELTDLVLKKEIELSGEFLKSCM